MPYVYIDVCIRHWWRIIVWYFRILLVSLTVSCSYTECLVAMYFGIVASTLRAGKLHHVPHICMNGIIMATLTLSYWYTDLYTYLITLPHSNLNIQLNVIFNLNVLTTNLGLNLTTGFGSYESFHYFIIIFKFLWV